MKTELDHLVSQVKDEAERKVRVLDIARHNRDVVLTLVKRLSKRKWTRSTYCSRDTWMKRPRVASCRFLLQIRLQRNSKLKKDRILVIGIRSSRHLMDRSFRTGIFLKHRHPLTLINWLCSSWTVVWVQRWDVLVRNQPSKCEKEWHS